LLWHAKRHKPKDFEEGFTPQVFIMIFDVSAVFNFCRWELSVDVLESLFSFLSVGNGEISKFDESRTSFIT